MEAKKRNEKLLPKDDVILYDNINVVRKLEISEFKPFFLSPLRSRT